MWTKVTIDQHDGIAAWVDPNDTWNGWVKPYFPVCAGDAINELMRKVDGDSLTYHKDGDYFETSDYAERFYGMEVDGMWLYPIGAGSWIWSLAE